MLTLNDGRSELWQWDTNRELTVDADCSQVHFSNKVFGRSIDVDVVDGVATIPDILLQTDKELTAWAFVGTAENGYTKISKVFKVNKRNKPAGYVFTPQDQSTLGEILDRIEDLENRPSGDISKEDIQNAVSDYLDKNPVSIEEKDPTVPAWAKQPEPPKVEIPEVDTPDALPNPHKLTFTGAVTAEYDGSKEVTVEIPEGGGGGGIEVTGASVGQTIVVKAVDENGKPTEWRTVINNPGLIEDCELIISGVLSSNSGITLTKDKDGNKISLTKAVLITKGAYANTNTINFGYNNINSNDYTFGVNGTTSESVFVGVLKKGSPMGAIQLSADGTVSKIINCYNCKQSDNGEILFPKMVKENITKVIFTNWWGPGVMAAGTIYALYGVRA